MDVVWALGDLRTKYKITYNNAQDSIYGNFFCGKNKSVNIGNQGPKSSFLLLKNKNKNLF